MRRGILLGAGALAVPCALGLHAGGAAAGMGLWLALVKSAGPRLPYPGARKSRVRFPRLFFAWAVSALFLVIGQWAVSAFAPAYARYVIALPLLRGALPFPAAALGERAFSLSLPDRLRVALGGGLLFLVFLITACTR